MFTFFRPYLQYAFNGSYLLVLALLTCTVKREESSSTAREALYFHILNLYAAGGDDGTCQRLCSNVFPHSDNRLSAQPHLLDSSHLTAALLSRTPDDFQA